MAKRVIARDRGRCHWCGRACADEADHVVELADGGADDVSNMRAIHHDCNLEKMRKRQAERRARAAPPHPDR
jgi:5-methylcytosine-specific restriction protein A